MVAVGNDVDVGQHVVEYGEIVDGEGADATAGRLVVDGVAAFETLHAVGEPGRPIVGEVGADGVVGTTRAVRVHLSFRPDVLGDGTALHAMPVLLEVDAPMFVADDVPVAV